MTTASTTASRRIKANKAKRQQETDWSRYSVEQVENIIFACSFLERNHKKHKVHKEEWQLMREQAEAELVRRSTT